MATEYAHQPTPVRQFHSPHSVEAPRGRRDGTTGTHAQRQISQGLGWFSLALGVTQLLAPRAMGRAIGVGEHPTLMRLLGLREIASGLGLLSQRQPGRWSWARVAGDAMDLALLAAAAAGRDADQRRIAMAAAAVAGVTALDIQASRRLQGVAAIASEPVTVHETLTVNSDPQTVYDFWRRLENLPRFMRHLESVTAIDERISHWVVRAPAGTTVEWDAEITSDHPHHRIGWRTLPGAQVEHAGTVNFEAAPAGRGTRLHVALSYVPPVGRLAVPIARLLGEEPQVQVKEDLRRFKQLIETGEVASTEGQPAGRRSLLGRSTLGRWLS